MAAATGVDVACVDASVESGRVELIGGWGGVLGVALCGLGHIDASGMPVAANISKGLVVQVESSQLVILGLALSRTLAILNLLIRGAVLVGEDTFEVQNGVVATYSKQGSLLLLTAENNKKRRLWHIV